MDDVITRAFANEEKIETAGPDFYMEVKVQGQFDRTLMRQELGGYLSAAKDCAVIVAGCRDYTDYLQITRHMCDVVSAIIPIVPTEHMRIVEGEARGVDSIAASTAQHIQVRVKPFPANWDLYGKKAGPIRNVEMAEFASKHNGVLIAFWDKHSHGTGNMIRVARKYKLFVFTVDISS